MSSNNTSIAERFCSLIATKTHENRRFKELEELSGIAAVSWRKAFTQGQRPTAEMIEFVSQAWPQYAFWLATGIDDQEFGHREPSPHEFNVLGNPITAAADLFLYRIAVYRAIGNDQRTIRASHHAAAIADFEALRWNQIQRRHQTESESNGNTEG